MIAAIYARASTDKQGDTVEHQVEICQEYAKRSNIKVTFDKKFIYKDEGESGFKTTLLQRPQMQNLLSDIDSGAIRVVIFKGISRFARDSAEAITAVKRLNNKGVRVVSIEENYDSHRDDPTMFQIYAVMAEQESRKTSVRVSLGNKQKARMGLWASGSLPLGYQKVKMIQDDELRGKLLKDGKHPQSLFPNECDWLVKKIFEMYGNEGFGRKRITSWLNENGHKTSKGYKFTESRLKDILSNEVYIGNIVYGKTRYEYIEEDHSNKKTQKTIQIDEKDWVRCENAHPPIIDKELFEKVQRIIRTKSKKYNSLGNFNAAKHPLTGILICGKCNTPMICQKRTNKKSDGTKLEYRYYVCSTYHSKGRNECDQKNMRADDLEEFIFELAKSKVNKIKVNKSELERIKGSDQNENLRKEMSALDANINKKTKAVSNLLENMELYDKDLFVKMNKEFMEELRIMKDRKIELSAQLKTIDTITSDDIDQLVNKFLKVKLSDHESLRELLHEYINEIVIVDKDIERIRWKYEM